MKMVQMTVLVIYKHYCIISALKHDRNSFPKHVCEYSFCLE